MATINRTPFAYFGGKYRILSNLQNYLPPSNSIDCYVEPFFGSGTLFFSRDRLAEVEVINDYNSFVYTFYKVLRDDYKKLLHRLKYTPYSKQTFLEAREFLSGGKYMITDSHKTIPVKDQVYTAWAVYLLYSMSIYRNGRNFSRDSIDTSKARSWEDRVAMLEYCAGRIKNATIENEDALETCKRYDSPRTVIYLDPPYRDVKNPRSMTMAYHGNDGKTQEKTAEQMHADLITWALQAKSKVIISNYHNQMYDEALRHWHVEEVDVKTVTVRAKRATSIVQDAKEVIWCNQVPTKQVALF